MYLNLGIYSGLGTLVGNGGTGVPEPLKTLSLTTLCFLEHGIELIDFYSAYCKKY